MAIRRTLAQFSDSIATADIAADAIDGTKIADNAIDSEHYTDASIDLAHMSVNSIDSDQYVDASIDTAHLASNIAISTSGAITTTGAFTSIGIDDNSNALAMTIDSSENIGIGTTSPAGRLDIATTAAGNLCYISSFSTTDGDQPVLYLRKSSSATIGTAAVTADGESLGSVAFRGVDSGGNWETAAMIKAIQDAASAARCPASLIFYTAKADDSLIERMRIDSDGLVMFGNTSSTAAQGYIDKETTSDMKFNIVASKSTSTNRIMTFKNRANVEAMRIDADGRVGIGIPVNSTPITAGLHVFENDDDKAGIRIFKYGTESGSSQIFMRFCRNDTGGNENANGQIVGSGSTSAAFASWSDERVKENIIDAPSQLDIINQLRVREFTFIGESEREIGFVAQEFIKVLPDAVGEEADEIKTMYIAGWSSSDARMVSAIQELSAKNDALETQVATLETQVATLEAVENDSSSSNAALEARILALESA